MTATVTIRDETLGGESLQSWALDVLTERLTVRELIRSRVYQEVQDFNVRQTQVFRGLVQPEDAEKDVADDAKITDPTITSQLTR